LRHVSIITILSKGNTVEETNNVSCLNSRAILDYVRRHHPGRVGELFVELPEPYLSQPDLEDFLLDETNWIPSSLVVKLFENARLITGNPNTAFEIGFESFTNREFSYIQRLFLTIFASPRGVLRRLNQMNTKLNNTKIVELVYDAPGRAVIRWLWREGVISSKDVCSYNKGIYSAIPTLWRLPPAEITESPCHFDGGPYCEIVLKWSLSRGRFRSILFQFLTRKSSLYNALEEVEKKETQLKQRFDQLDAANRELGEKVTMLGIQGKELSALNNKLDQKVTMLKALSSATHAIVSMQDTQEMLEATMEPIVSVLGFERALIMLVDDSNEFLEYRYGVGDSPEAREKMSGYRIPLSREHNLMIRVLRKKKPVIVRDVRRAGLNPANVILADFRPTSFVVTPLISEDTVIGLLGADRGACGARVTSNDGEYLSILANSLATAISRTRIDQERGRIDVERARKVEELKSSYENAVQALVQAIEEKDNYTRGHSERVAFMVVEIGEFLGLPPVEIEFLRFGSILHDVGKIGVPESIVRNHRSLTAAERKIIQLHPMKGVEILKPIAFIQDHMCMVRNHHERYDGKGYPDGLKGDAIPLGAQICAVADAFDAMTTNRPYRKGLPFKQAAKEIRENCGSQFAPRIADAFLELFDRPELIQKLSLLHKK
jgi:GAF domain-containing protein